MLSIGLDKYNQIIFLPNPLVSQYLYLNSGRYFPKMFINVAQKKLVMKEYLAFFRLPVNLNLKLDRKETEKCQSKLCDPKALFFAVLISLIFGALAMV